MKTTLYLVDRVQTDGLVPPRALTNRCEGNHTIIWICPSVCLLAIFSDVCGSIETKLGRAAGYGICTDPPAVNNDHSLHENIDN